MAAYGSDLRMVLLGKTGSGKSAAGNLILGRKDFSVSMSSKSVTRKCDKYESTEFSRKISVVDTPGLFDTEITVDKLKAEIERCVELSVPGPHVFLLGIRLGVRFTAEERNTVDWIQENFGKEALKHTIVLFTHADALKMQIEQYIGDDKHLKQLVAECGGRYHLFNNEDMENRSQVRELLKKINVLSSTYYTNEMYQAVQKRLEEEKEKKRKEEEERIQQWEEKIRAEERKKFEEEKQRKKEEENRKQWEEWIRAEERKKFEEENQRKKEEENRKQWEESIRAEKVKRNKKIAVGAGAGLAVGGVASGAAVAAAVVAEIGLVAVAAPVALVALPAIGAAIAWALYKKIKNKDGYEPL